MIAKINSKKLEAVDPTETLIDKENKVKKGTETLEPPLLEKTEEKEEEEGQMYQIYQDDVEYFTIIKPVIKNTALCCRKLIKKSAVTENKGLPKSITRYYAENCEDMEFDLTSGIILKIVDEADLDWLGITKVEAETQLKDDLLIYYQKLIPDLIEKLNQAVNKNNNSNRNNLLI